MLVQNETPAAVSTPRLTISMKEFCQLSGMGKSKAYLLIAEGKLAVARVGRRTLISYESAIALVAPGLRDHYLESLRSASPISISSNDGEAK